MLKVIFGSLLMTGGLILTFVPPFIIGPFILMGGAWLIFAGITQLGWRTAKTTAKVASSYNNSRKASPATPASPTFDVQKWKALKEVDPDIAKIANFIREKHGDRYENMFAEKYLALNDKQYLRQCAETVVAAAKEEASKPTEGTIGKSDFVKRDGTYVITRGIGAGKSFNTYDELYEYARL